MEREFNLKKERIPKFKEVIKELPSLKFIGNPFEINQEEIRIHIEITAEDSNKLNNFLYESN